MSSYDSDSSDGGDLLRTSELRLRMLARMKSNAFDEAAAQSQNAQTVYESDLDEQNNEAQDEIEDQSEERAEQSELLELVEDHIKSCARPQGMAYDKQPVSLASAHVSTQTEPARDFVTRFQRACQQLSEKSARIKQLTEELEALKKRLSAAEDASNRKSRRPEAAPDSQAGPSSEQHTKDLPESNQRGDSAKLYTSISLLKSGNHFLRTSNKTFERRIAFLEGQNNTLSNEVKALGDLRVQIGCFKTDLDKKQAALEDAIDMRESAESEALSLKGKLRAETESSATLRQRIWELENQLFFIRPRLETLEAANPKLQLEIIDIRTDLRCTKRNLEHEKRSRGEEVDELRNTMRDVVLNNAQLLKEKTELNAQIGALRSEQDRLKNTIQDAATNNTQLLKEKTDLNAQIGALRGEQDGLKKQISNLRRHLAQRTKERNRAQVTARQCVPVVGKYIRATQYLGVHRRLAQQLRSDARNTQAQLRSDVRIAQAQLRFAQPLVSQAMSQPVTIHTLTTQRDQARTDLTETQTLNQTVTSERDQARSAAAALLPWFFICIGTVQALMQARAALGQFQVHLQTVTDERNEACRITRVICPFLFKCIRAKGALNQQRAALTQAQTNIQTVTTERDEALTQLQTITSERDAARYLARVMAPYFFKYAGKVTALSAARSRTQTVTTERDEAVVKLQTVTSERDQARRVARVAVPYVFRSFGIAKKLLLKQNALVQEQQQVQTLSATLKLEETRLLALEQEYTNAIDVKKKLLITLLEHRKSSREYRLNTHRRFNIGMAHNHGMKIEHAAREKELTMHVNSLIDCRSLLIAILHQSLPSPKNRMTFDELKADYAHPEGIYKATLERVETHAALWKAHQADYESCKAGQEALIEAHEKLLDEVDRICAERAVIDEERSSQSTRIASLEQDLIKTTKALDKTIKMYHKANEIWESAKSKTDASVQAFVEGSARMQEFIDQKWKEGKIP